MEKGTEIFGLATLLSMHRRAVNPCSKDLKSKSMGKRSPGELLYLKRDHTKGTRSDHPKAQKGWEM